MRPAAVFDIDGTLTATSAIDARCYATALHLTFGLSLPTIDWDNYRDVTDSGILGEIFIESCGRMPTAADTAEFITSLLSELTRAYEQDPDSFAPVFGAAAFLERLEAEGWVVAFATGAWGASGRFKLHCAGIGVDRPFASADDGQSRQLIVQTALHRAGVEARHNGNVVAFGDGKWDVEAAAHLGFPCIGVGTGQAVSQLKSVGALAVVPDYSNPDDVVALLNAAVARNAV